jgi:hypothetical protein
LACASSISYNYDWDRDEDLTKYTSFSLMAPPQTIPGDVRTAREQSDLLDKRIRRAVSAQLEAKGHRQDETSPSFLVAYHVGSEDKVSVTDWGYRYGPGPWGYYGRDIDVHQYTQGTLVVDFIDASTKQLFWRGEASKAVDQNATQEEIDQVINEAVSGILRNWPPKQ